MMGFEVDFLGGESIFITSSQSIQKFEAWFNITRSFAYTDIEDLLLVFNTADYKKTNSSYVYESVEDPVNYIVSKL